MAAGRRGVGDTKERIRVSVKSLNRKLLPGTSRFHSDGMGAKVAWEVAG
jgi:hypothetical protein